MKSCTGLLGILIFSMVLVSCSSGSKLNVQAKNSSDSDACIPPQETFVYSAYPDLKKIPGSPGMQIPPNWTVEMDLPDSYGLLLSRAKGSHVELWFAQAVSDPNDVAWGKYFRNFQVYDYSTKKMKAINAEIGTSGIYAGKIFESPDGSIWSLNNIKTINSYVGDTPYSILSRYNEKTQRFDFVEEAQRIPYSGNEDKGDSTYWVEMVIDQDGMLWFIVPSDAIYSYDSIKREVKRWAGIPELVTADPVISPGGSIYFLDLKFVRDGGTVSSSQDISIYQFNPKAGKVEFVPFRIDPWPPFSTILVDHKGRLWADGLAYREPNGHVYQLERAPIFLVPYFESGMDYRWDAPDIIKETSDGRLWFHSRNGLAWLDLDAQKWCWLSTSQSSLFEDQQNNVWMTAYGKLYRTKIVPKK